MLKLYRWSHYFGRRGDLGCLFLEKEEAVQKYVGREVHFGEVLGKHSDVYCTFNEGDIEVVTDDQEFLAKFAEIMGFGTISGHNPISYLQDQDEEEAERFEDEE